MALEFANFFYHNLFQGRTTVKIAFDRARQACEFNHEDAIPMCLLPKDANHDSNLEDIFFDVPNLCVDRMMHSDPNLIYKPIRP